MALFTVLEAPDGKLDRVKFVAEGFSRMGFLLTVIWALCFRMWVVASALFLIIVAIGLALTLNLIDMPVAIVLQLGVMVVVGLEGRMLQVMSLERAGYRVRGLVEVSSLEAAEQVYFSHRKAFSASSSAVMVRGIPENTLGIFGNV